MVKEGRRRVTLHAIADGASVLYRLRAVFWLLAGAGGAWFGYLLADSSSAADTVLGAFSLTLWALLALGTGYLLPRIPAPVIPDDGVRQRVGKRVAITAYWLGAVAMAGLALLALYLTWQALGLTLRS